MARKEELDSTEKALLLRELAFHIHRKRPAAEALEDYIAGQGKLGRHREVRAAADALAQQGFLAAIQVLGLVGDEAAAILTAVIGADDHRLLAKTLAHLADHRDEQAG
jgi:hypothetical protein